MSYVDFVTDEQFLECVNYVCKEYEKVNDDITRNGLDVNKMLFDIGNSNQTFDEWFSQERLIQDNDTVRNAIGNFHQKLLGFVDGWKDLGNGHHDSHVDLMKEDQTIFIELKNKHNTLTGTHHSHVYSILENIVNQNETTIAYYAYIIPKNGQSKLTHWKVSGNTHPRIFTACGVKTYEIVTGNIDSLKNMWLAIPKALNDLDYKIKINEKFEDFFQKTFLKKEPLVEY